MKPSNISAAMFAVLALILLGACGSEDVTTESVEPSGDSAQASTGTDDAAAAPAPGLSETDSGDAIAAAVGHTGRPDADITRDAFRKPGRVLAFFGIEPGMRVFEYGAGSGYYTEILSHLLGPEGEVIAHNNPAFAQYYREELTERLENGAYENVSEMEISPDEIDLAANSIDAAVIILAYHDLFFAPEGSDAGLPDRAHLLDEIRGALKPGGILGVIDHVAAKGTDPKVTGAEIHRIDPDFVRQEIEAAGFVLAETADFLRNPEDNIEEPFWTRESGTSDRFVFRFDVVK